MLRKPDGYDEALENAIELAGSVEGLLKDSEVRLLFMLGACPTAEGEVLEIGSFRGKSATVLGKATELAGESRIFAVDPLTSPSKTDPDLGGEESGRRRFEENLKRTGVRERVEFSQMPSGELAVSWRHRLRLLWIDGDHTYMGAKNDFDLFSPFLSEGAIVAMHDVLHRFDGPIRVFIEDVLCSDSFGAAGVVGSTGWAQYLGAGSPGAGFSARRARLASRLRRAERFQSDYERPLGWLDRKLYRLARTLVPHAELNPEKWFSMVESRRSVPKP